MGVYISSLELPNKDYGKMVVTIYPDGSVVEYLGDIGRDFGTAVPIPPHGRLGDLDALIEQIEFEIQHYVVKDEFDKGRVVGWKNIIRAIREYTPTIIPASKEGE